MSVRPGGGIFSGLDRGRHATTASSASVATPLALSFAPGSCTCAARTTRSSGATLPGISATSVRDRLVHERAGDGHADLDRRCGRGRPQRQPVALAPLAAAPPRAATP